MRRKTDYFYAYFGNHPKLNDALTLINKEEIDFLKNVYGDSLKGFKRKITKDEERILNNIFNKIKNRLKNLDNESISASVSDDISASVSDDISASVSDDISTNTKSKERKSRDYFYEYFDNDPRLDECFSYLSKKRIDFLKSVYGDDLKGKKRELNTNEKGILNAIFIRLKKILSNNYSSRSRDLFYEYFDNDPRLNEFINRLSKKHLDFLKSVYGNDLKGKKRKLTKNESGYLYFILDRLKRMFSNDNTPRSRDLLYEYFDNNKYIDRALLLLSDSQIKFLKYVYGDDLRSKRKKLDSKKLTKLTSVLKNINKNIQILTMPLNEYFDNKDDLNIILEKITLDDKKFLNYVYDNDFNNKPKELSKEESIRLLSIFKLINLYSNKIDRGKYNIYNFLKCDKDTFLEALELLTDYKKNLIKITEDEEIYFSKNDSNLKVDLRLNVLIIKIKNKLKNIDFNELLPYLKTKSTGSLNTIYKALDDKDLLKGITLIFDFDSIPNDLTKVFNLEKEKIKKYIELLDKKKIINQYYDEDLKLVKRLDYKNYFYIATLILEIKNKMSQKYRDTSNVYLYLFEFSKEEIDEELSKLDDNKKELLNSYEKIKNDKTLHQTYNRYLRSLLIKLNIKHLFNGSDNIQIRNAYKKLDDSKKEILIKCLGKDICLPIWQDVSEEEYESALVIIEEMNAYIKSNTINSKKKVNKKNTLSKNTFAEIISSLYEGNIDNGINLIVKYLKDIKEDKLFDLVMLYLKIDTLNKDKSYYSLATFLSNINSSNYGLFIGNAIEGFYNALSNLNYTLCRLYINVLLEFNKLGNKSDFIEICNNLFNNVFNGVKEIDSSVLKELDEQIKLTKVVIK